MSNWLNKVKETLFRTRRSPIRTVRNDPYGHGLDGRPRFLLRPLFERFIAKTSMPEDQKNLLDNLATQGTIVYAIKYRSQLDFLYANVRLYQLGLPSPDFVFDLTPYAFQPWWYAFKLRIYHLYKYVRHGDLPDAYEGGYYRRLVQDGRTGMFFLLGKKGYYQRTVLVQNEPIGHLLDIQKDLDRPIFIVPLVILYTRDPGRERSKGFASVLRQRGQPGSIRKLWRFFRGRSDTVIEVGEPLNLQDVLPELAERRSQRRNQMFQLRRELIESADHIRRAIVGPQIKSKLELKEIILHHPRLETFMRRRAKSTGEKMWKVRQEADKYLEEIAADYSYNLIQIGEKILTWMWTNLFDGVDIDMDGLHRVKRAARHNTLIYIPCHKSHIDYLILSYILFTNNLYTPFIAAGRNLAFWPLGPIFRRGGAFFIRRSFKGQRFYAEVFTLYVKVMVQLGHNIEFFIEGGRSRTGKLVLPKLGLLAILIQAVEEGFCDDLVFVPTAICYDRIPEEEAYLKEVTGGSKTAENLSQLVRARRFLKKRYGRVYVQFAEPISLRRYMERYHYDFKEMTSKQRHAMHRDFGYRIIHHINKVSLVTPHALVSAALLSTSRRGISMPELLETCQDFKGVLDNAKVSFSRTLRSFDRAIQDTLADLERGKLISRLKDEDDDLEEEVFTMEDAKRMTLEYYKNNIIHFLLPGAMVATSILAQETFRFSLSQILEDVAFMKDFFKFEFVYDSDVADFQLVHRVLDGFESFGWLRRLEPSEEYPYLMTHKGLRVAEAFHGLIRNYFEGYWVVLRSLRYLEKKTYTEKDFVKKILATGQKMLKLELIERPESVSKLIYLNALQYYGEKGVISKSTDREKNKGQSIYQDGGDRQQIQYYSRVISRLLRSPHFSLQ